MSTQLVIVQYNDTISVNFTQDAWFNATEVAKHFGKKPNEWLRLESTQDYINCVTEFQLRENPANEQNQLVITKTGQIENGGGSWLHPKLAVAFARWLDVRFAVWCDMQIEKLLRPVPYGLKDLPPAHISEAEARQLSKAITTVEKGQQSQKLYRKLYDAYRITSYKHLPAGKLNEALVFLGLRKPEIDEMVLVKQSELTALPKPQSTQDIAASLNDNFGKYASGGLVLVDRKLLTSVKSIIEHLI